jgi:hypothetical protein
MSGGDERVQAQSFIAETSSAPWSLFIAMFCYLSDQLTGTPVQLILEA